MSSDWYFLEEHYHVGDVTDDWNTWDGLHRFRVARDFRFQWIRKLFGLRIREVIVGVVE